jgi:PHP family Zn ribbon phosphoesterase
MGKNNIEEWFERFGYSPDTTEPVLRHARLKPVIVEKVTHAPANRKNVLRCARCGSKMKLVRRFRKLTASCPRCGGTASQGND